MNCGEIREKVKKFVLILEKNKIKYKTYDYGLGLVALNKNDAIHIVQMFRPERDGYEGMRIMTDDMFEDILKEIKGIS
jgi:hypothetical protein